MKTIICPTDFSPASENAVKYALALNKHFNAKIILLHTYETPVLYTDIAPFTMQMDYKFVHDAAAKKLKAFHNKIMADSPFKVELVLQQGVASYRINELAVEKKADMVIMGATGTGAAERLLIGSNAARVANNATCKVLIVPAKARFGGIDKMVYATDLSDDNLKHAKEIFPFAKKLNAEIQFLYIDNDLQNSDEILERVTKTIRKKISYAKKSGYVCNDPLVLKGLSFFLKNKKADCIVLYHRHRNIFQSIFKSSVSKNFSLHSNIPVLIIHQNDLSFRQ
ncbi:MAG TPA: universal stress protein [Bacteroidia bacterium]|nr:universal stress protein [Bacteroidia bacterium]HNU34869.1 universal stress protein [Bacteroidia bacterium]